MGVISIVHYLCIRTRAYLFTIRSFVFLFADFAIVKLSETFETPFRKNGSITIDLIQLNSKVSNSGFDERPLVLSGWGLTENGEPAKYLRFTETPMRGVSNNNSNFGGRESDRGFCVGDSGGILITRKHPSS